MSGYGTTADGGHRDGVPATATIELAVTGRLDQAAVSRVGAMFDEVLERRPGRILLDVAHCHYADAAGIALLLDLHRRSRRAGGSLELRAPSARLCRLLEIARVNHVLRIESSARPPGPANRSDRAVGLARPGARRDDP